MELRDKVVIVTGGANGIGAAMCRRFVAEGATEVVAADLVRSEADGVTGVELDVTDEAATREMVEEVERRHGRIDLFCANAGIARAEGLEMSDDALAEDVGGERVLARHRRPGGAPRHARTR
jgi:NAD(P)-dependent dehydrogenase (short-subunit alcohol dehydrogenase family)